jgi:hypothetical protein
VEGDDFDRPRFFGADRPRNFGEPIRGGFPQFNLFGPD